MSKAKEMQVTGRMVLFTLIAFFAVVTTVNAIMATLAITTFGGVEAENAYRAGLEFARELRSARAQQLRELRIDVATNPAPKGETEFKLTTRNIDAGFAAALRATIELRHPADKRRDRVVTLNRQTDGTFLGNVTIDSGQWNARISLYQGEERVFHSINRMTIP